MVSHSNFLNLSVYTDCIFYHFRFSFTHCVCYSVEFLSYVCSSTVILLDFVTGFSKLWRTTISGLRGMIGQTHIFLTRKSHRTHVPCHLECCVCWVFFLWGCQAEQSSSALTGSLTQGLRKPVAKFQNKTS